MTLPTPYAFPSTDAEARRLGLQALLYGGIDPLEPLLSLAPRAVLDAGCGAGHYAALLARRLPDAQVTGVDRDPGCVERARGWHAGPNLTFLAGDLLELPFEDATFDLTLTRFVLAFLDDATGACSELARVTRPGGRVACHEMIHEGIWFSPARPALSRLMDGVVAHLRRVACRPNQGLHLAGAMCRAGLTGVEVRPLTHLARAPGDLYDATRRNWAQMVEGMLEQLGDALPSGLAAEALTELEQHRDDDLFLEVSTLTVGTVPG